MGQTSCAPGDAHSLVNVMPNLNTTNVKKTVILVMTLEAQRFALWAQDLKVPGTISSTANMVNELF